MKVTLEYDPNTGTLTDANGIHVVTYMGVKSFEDHQDPSNPKDLVILKEAGFTAEEIIAMKKKEIF